MVGVDQRWEIALGLRLGGVKGDAVKRATDRGPDEYAVDQRFQERRFPRRQANQ